MGPTGSDVPKVRHWSHGHHGHRLCTMVALQVSSAVGLPRRAEPGLFHCPWSQNEDSPAGESRISVSKPRL